MTKIKVFANYMYGEGLEAHFNEWSGLHPEYTITSVQFQATRGSLGLSYSALVTYETEEKEN